MSETALAEYIDGLPNICGSEEAIAEAMSRPGPAYLPHSGIDFGRIRGAFSIALHMHQPLIPAGGGDLRTAALISNLNYMMDNQHIGDNHNAPVLHWCYKRMGEFIPQLVHEGKNPRVMLDYSGCLLHGLRAMGLNEVFDNLKRITLDPAYRRSVEWLGTAWGHAVAPSTPVQDFRLHVRAWQHHFAAIFGVEALSRVRGFSPPEMALPNHPDVCYEFVRTLKDCGYRWVILQKRIWERFPEPAGPEALEKVIEELRKQDGRFHMEGGSWTNNLSWVRGYDHVLGPVGQASALFAEKASNVPTSDPRYRNALYHLLMAQTSCFRYWGSGIWTDYAREFCWRTSDILRCDF